jgi:hypothetical protein
VPKICSEEKIARNCANEEYQHPDENSLSKTPHALNTTAATRRGLQNRVCFYPVYCHHCHQPDTRQCRTVAAPIFRALESGQYGRQAPYRSASLP